MTQFESISRNDFIKNQNTPQASDSGFPNTYEGNYWDEVAHQDFNNDGINDFEYMLDGNTGSEDLSPSTKQVVDETVKIDVGCELDLINNSKELQNLTSQLELESRLELPISRFTVLSFSIVILVGIVALIIFRRKIIK